MQSYRSEIKRPWWYRTLRAINLFCFHYWWLILLLFISYLFLWYWFCFRPVTIHEDCNNIELLKVNTEKLKKTLDNCCDCETKTDSTEKLKSDTVLPISGLNWDLIDNNPCVLSGSSWIISPDNTVLRYNIINSENCGGPCSSVQSGTAKANITVGEKDVLLYLDFDGVGELQNPEFELINFKLDNQLVANAHAAGGNKGCEFGPVIKKYLQKSPYFLPKRSKHLFEVNFTTNDEKYHVNCYYEVRLRLEEVNP